MELVNLLVIIIMVTVCLVWAMRKKREIETTTINFNQADNPHTQGADSENDLTRDQEDLSHTANVLQASVLAMMKKIHNVCLILFAVLGVIVWVSFFAFAFRLRRFLPHRSASKRRSQT